LKISIVTRIEGGIPEIVHVTDAEGALSPNVPHELWETGYYAVPDSDVEWRVDVATMDPAAFERMGAKRYGGLFALMLAFHKAEQEASA